MNKLYKEKHIKYKIILQHIRKNLPYTCKIYHHFFFPHPIHNLNNMMVHSKSNRDINKVNIHFHLNNNQNYQYHNHNILLNLNNHYKEKYKVYTHYLIYNDLQYNLYKSQELYHKLNKEVQEYIIQILLNVSFK